MGWHVFWVVTHVIALGVILKYMVDEAKGRLPSSMNEKAKTELVRQLMEMGHHFYTCPDCKQSFQSEMDAFPMVRCPSCGAVVKALPAPEHAASTYRQVIEGAIKWGDTP